MNGREDKKSNDLFFLCSLIEYMGRKTQNDRTYIVNQLGKEELEHIYDLADVYHCENIDKLTEEFSSKHNITHGNYDNISPALYEIPTHWDIGKIMRRLIQKVSETHGKSIIESLIEVYNSWFPKSIDNYNSAMYYLNPGYHFASYEEGYPLEY